MCVSKSHAFGDDSEAADFCRYYWTVQSAMRMLCDEDVQLLHLGPDPHMKVSTPSRVKLAGLQPPQRQPLCPRNSAAGPDC